MLPAGSLRACRCELAASQLYLYIQLSLFTIPASDRWSRFRLLSSPWTVSPTSNRLPALDDYSRLRSLFRLRSLIRLRRMYQHPPGCLDEQCIPILFYNGSSRRPLGLRVRPPMRCQTHPATPACRDYMTIAITAIGIASFAISNVNSLGIAHFVRYYQRTKGKKDSERCKIRRMQTSYRE